MHNLQQGIRSMLLLALAVLLGSPTSPPAQARQHSSACTQAAEAPGPQDRSQAGPGGELSLDQKQLAFASVLRGQQRFGDYLFPVAITRQDSTTLAPVLLQSVAGIESDWTQYSDGSTNVNLDSCDFGLMQINEVAQANLFSKQPSLRSDTRANIAAGAQTLSTLWANGLFATLPLVNDGDPTWLSNWYYVLSSYNAGPTATGWVNNPACGELLTCGEDGKITYSARRPKGGMADWTELSLDAYPYQERVLNNLPFPRTLGQQPTTAGAEWLVAGLGLQGATAQADTGLLPEDRLFVRPDPATGDLVSYAPNLMLVQHRAEPLLPDVNWQQIVFEYELPFAAQVTLTLVLANGSEQPLCSQAGKAGWSRVSCRAGLRLSNGDGYRLRAERGDPAQPASYYLGQHRELFSFQDTHQHSQSLRYAVYAPLVQNSGRPQSLFNQHFREADPHAPWKPNYWDAQVLVSRQPGRELPDIFDVVAQSNDKQGWDVLATPSGVVDLRQRITLAPGRYLLRIGLDVQGRDAASLLRIRTRPALPGPNPWTEVDLIPASASGSQNKQYWLQLNGPITLSLLANFGPQDQRSAFTLRAVELFR